MKKHGYGIAKRNGKFINRRLNPEKGHKFMPYIVVVRFGSRFSLISLLQLSLLKLVWVPVKEHLSTG